MGYGGLAYLGVKFSQLLVIHVALCVHPSLVAKLKAHTHTNTQKQIHTYEWLKLPQIKEKYNTTTSEAISKVSQNMHTFCIGSTYSTTFLDASYDFFSRLSVAVPLLIIQSVII